MPQIPVTSPLGYIGVALLLLGLFLVLAGLGIIEIKQVTVKPGTKTWGFGSALVIIGIVFLLPEILGTTSPPSTPTPTGTTAASSTTDALSPIPTSTIDADPMVYDNFNNPVFDGNFNTGLWKNIDTNNTKVKQQDGVLIISREADSLGLLNTINPLKWKLDQIGTLETTMMLDGDIKGSEGGNVHTVFGYWADGQWWGAVISIYGKKGDSAAWAAFDTSDYNGNGTSVPFNTWITVRFETDPNTATISAFADGHKIDEYTPPDPEAFKQREFEVIVGVWSFGGGLVTGSVDNVRIGQFGK